MQSQIVTGADKLLDLVQDNSEISITRAANELKVDKHIVHEWSEALEEAGLVQSSFSLKDRHLCCTGSLRNKMGASNKLKRFLGKITISTKSFNEHELNAKRAELKCQLKELDVKLSELKKYQKAKSQTRKYLDRMKKERYSLDEKRKELLKLETTLEKHEKELSARTQALENSEKDISAREAKVRTLNEDLEKKERQLKQLESTLEKKSAQLDKTVGKIVSIAKS